MDVTDSEQTASGHDVVDLHLSDVHIGHCPPGTGFWTTSIRLCLASPANNAASSVVQTDEDGDLCLERRRIWKIQHLRETTLDAVGGQIWRGSCLLSDFVLSSPGPFQDKNILELGCGVGLTGIALHGIAREVYLTDHNLAALQLCQENIHQNTAHPDLFSIRMLDWTRLDEIFSPQDGSKDTESAAFRWMDKDREVLTSVDVFLAADVIYDPPLTSAFFQTLARLMRYSQKDSICYLSLEKRFNFTLEDLDVRDPAYEHFLSFVDSLNGGAFWSEFVGERLPLESIPQAKTITLAMPNSHFVQLQVLDIPRSKDMELWKIWLRNAAHVSM